MMEGFVCNICGKHLKTAAGLAGHKMLAHPAAKAAASVSPEEGLIELLGAVKEANDRLDSEVKGFQAQLGVLTQRLDGFQSSFEAASSARVSQLKQENARLDQKIVKLQSPEYEREVLHDYLRNMTPEKFYELGIKLGYQIKSVKAIEVDQEEREEAGEKEPGLLASLVSSFNKKPQEE